MPVSGDCPHPVLVPHCHRQHEPSAGLRTFHSSHSVRSHCSPAGLDNSLSVASPPCASDCKVEVMVGLAPQLLWELTERLKSRTNAHTVSPYLEEALGSQSSQHGSVLRPRGGRRKACKTRCIVTGHF